MPLQFVKLAPRLCAVLVHQVSPVFVQQNVEKRRQQVNSGTRDLLKDEIAASQEVEDKGRKPFIEDTLPETPKMLEAREEYIVYAWKNRRDHLVATEGELIGSAWIFTFT